MFWNVVAHPEAYRLLIDRDGNLVEVGCHVQVPLPLFPLNPSVTAVTRRVLIRTGEDIVKNGLPKGVYLPDP